jgi:asparagine synthase (glutamine-hydrolysing)
VGGIAGIWQPGRQVDPDLVRRMLAAMRHRGPEGASFARADRGGLVLGFLKLGITDQQGGHQPLFTQKGHYGLVYNGEIYDYDVLRGRLAARGHYFDTASDSEVVLNLYAEYGPDFTEYLNGEFAFALWDERRRQLNFVRDRFGVKPLYVADYDGGLAFASEMKALMALPNFPRELDPHWFSGPGLGMAGCAQTPFVGIRQIRPATIERHDARGSRRDLVYWRPTFAPGFTGDAKQAATELRVALDKAVARRVGGDVPIAVALCRGVDSAMVAGLVGKHRPDRVGYCAAFPGEEFDESVGAQMTARHAGLGFAPVDCPIDVLAEGFMKSVWSTEVPTNSLSTTARLRVTAAIRADGNKAVIGGEFGDVLFGGHPCFEPESPSAYTRRARRLSRAMPWLLTDATLHALRGESPLSRIRDEFDLPWLRSLDPFDGARVLSRSIVSTSVLPLGDRVEMANSLEGRAPFLDLDVLNFAYQLDASLCTDSKDGRRRAVLRTACADLLPPAHQAPRKQTQMAPTFASLRREPLGKDVLEALLSRDVVGQVGVFRPNTVRLLRRLWRLAPQHGPRSAFLDATVGYIASVSALHHVFVDRPGTFEDASPMRWRDRSPRKRSRL